VPVVSARGEPGDPAEVGHRGADDVHAAVGVVDPVDGNFVDAQPAALGQDEQFGVEKPGVVLHKREQVRGDLAADGFESALGVGEAGEQGVAQHQVVAAGDEFSFRPADYSGSAVQPCSDGQVGVAGDQWCNQRQQRGEIGG
jgi:hypothetical protein